MLPTFADLVRVARPDLQGKSSVQWRAIYIMPTRFGMMFLVLLLLLLIGSINYANSPAFLLTFLLGGLFIQAIFATWRNLLGLHLSWLGAEPVFAGEQARFAFLLESDGRAPKWAVQLGFQGENAEVVDLPEGSNELSLSYPAPLRGWLEPGRITLETRYPLGLLRAWCYAETKARVLVYPKPEDDGKKMQSPDLSGTLDSDQGRGVDDFSGHRGYQVGDSPRHINWKLYAADKGLFIKEFGGDRTKQIWLDYDQIGSHDMERRLSLLTGKALAAEKDGLNYGLRLPNKELRPARGQAHLSACLTALALFRLS